MTLLGYLAASHMPLAAFSTSLLVIVDGYLIGFDFRHGVSPSEYGPLEARILGLIHGEIASEAHLDNSGYVFRSDVIYLTKVFLCARRPIFRTS